jgi:hypothetical protein
VYEGTCNYSIKMCVSRKDNVRVMYMCMRVPVTILLYVCAKPGQCSGHVYVDGGSCHYSIKTYVSSQANVGVMYICIRVPVTILLRCMCQARTVFGSCIGV